MSSVLLQRRLPQLAPSCSKTMQDRAQSASHKPSARREPYDGTPARPRHRKTSLPPIITPALHDHRAEPIHLADVHTLSNEFNSDPGNVDWNRWISSHPMVLTASSLRKPPTQGNIPDPDSEARHGETVSV
jgi:hypothetical protein